MASPENPIADYAIAFDTTCEILADPPVDPDGLPEDPTANAQMSGLITYLRGQGYSFFEIQDLLLQAGAEHGRMEIDKERGAEEL